MASDANATHQNETTLYSDERGIRVTNTRLICANATYSMANFSSVAVKRDKINLNIVGLLSLCLVVWGIGSSEKLVSVSLVGSVGTIVFLSAFFMAAAFRKWTLAVTSSSGETSLIRSRKKDYIEKIARAIQEALTLRG